MINAMNRKNMYRLWTCKETKEIEPLQPSLCWRLESTQIYRCTCSLHKLKNHLSLHLHLHPIQFHSSYFCLANRVQHFTSNQVCLITIEPLPWNSQHHRNPFQSHKHQYHLHFHLPWKAERSMPGYLNWRGRQEKCLNSHMPWPYMMSDLCNQTRIY